MHEKYIRVSLMGMSVVGVLGVVNTATSYLMCQLVGIGYSEWMTAMFPHALTFTGFCVVAGWCAGTAWGLKERANNAKQRVSQSLPPDRP